MSGNSVWLFGFTWLLVLPLGWFLSRLTRARASSRRKLDEKLAASYAASRRCIQHAARVNTAYITLSQAAYAGNVAAYLKCHAEYMEITRTPVRIWLTNPDQS